MEFIMTYGWAILAVTVVIGALVYFGVFSPSRLLPEQCTFPADLSCVGKALADPSTGYLTFALANNVGYRIEILDTISGTENCASPVLISVSGDGQNISHNGQATLVVNCGTIAAGRFKADLTVNYLNTYNGLDYPATGGIQANAQ